MVEHLFCKQDVGGSIPLAGLLLLRHCEPAFFLAGEAISQRAMGLLGCFAAGNDV